MEIYILDSNLRRNEVVEQYESFIWTERYAEAGDFVLEIDPTLAEPKLRVGGTMLACDQSDRVMVVDTSEEVIKEDGDKILKVWGTSLEASVMSNRPNDYSLLAVYGGKGTIIFATDTPGKIMRDLFARVCLSNNVVAQDIIPNLQSGSYSSSVGAIPEPVDAVSIQTELDNLYNTIKNIADTYRMGFRLIRVEDANPANPAKLYFEVYTGFDRTTSQTAKPAVVFSPLLDNLTDTSELKSIAAFKNVIYIYAVNGSGIFYDDNTPTTVSGFDRRVLTILADDITDAAGAGLNAKLAQRAREEFAQNRPTVGFDGKITQTSNLVYGIDYKLGDLVEKRTDTGLRNAMKVTEQIFTSDKEGTKSFPTLSLNSLVLPGSWNAANPTKTWNSYTTEVWNSM